MKLIIALALTLAAIAAPAQTISPLTAEMGHKVKGEFEFTNNGFTPLAVTLEVKSLKFVNGKPTLVDLDPTVHVRLKEFSARVGAKQTHTFYYDSKRDTDQPYAFVIFTVFMGGHTNEGVAVTPHVGTTVYACERAKDCRASFWRQE